MDKRQITQGHLSAFISIFIWGTTFISTKVLLDSFSPIEILFFRIVIAYFVLLLIYPRIMKFLSWKEERLFMAAGLCGVTLYFIFQNTALTYTLASNAGILISVAPFFTAFLSHFFLREEHLTASFFIGFAVAIAGIILIEFNGNFYLKLNPRGDLLAIFSAVAWALYCVVMKKISAYHYHPIQSTRKIFLYGLLFMIPSLSLFEFQLGLPRFKYIPNLLNILFLAIGASAFCFITWNFAVSVLGAVKTSVYIYIVPVISVVMAAIVLGEKITLMAIIGVILILAGLYLSERKNETIDQTFRFRNISGK
ncbi:MAG: DMT family transporter [Anaerolineales bacterium]|nr:DMT family transporter [Anaerolineales bacterium]